MSKKSQKTKSRAKTEKKGRVSERQPWTVEDGRKLREMRQSFGLSQSHVAVGVGVTSSRICEVEKVDFPGGRHCSPGKELGEKIASFFAHKAQAMGEKVASAKAEAAEAKAAARTKAKAAKAEKPAGREEAKPA